MHNSSYLEMGLNIKRYLRGLPPKSIVADIGSQDFNGSYRDLFKPPLKYLGIDLVSGKNVDRVMNSEFDTGLPDSFAAAVISGQCLEHTPQPGLLVNEMFRICAPGGCVLICAPFAFPIHRYPKDYWRFCPDGLEALIEAAGGTVLRSYLYDQDCWGIGQLE